MPEPQVGGDAAAGVEAFEEVPIEVARAFVRQALEFFVDRNTADAQSPQFLSGPDHFPEFERLELTVERGVELDLLDALGDIARRLWQPGRLDRRDLNDERVIAFRGADKRDQRRIGRIAAVPIGFAVDFDRMMQQRQAGRGEDRLDGQLGVGQNSQAAVADPGRGEIGRASCRERVCELV